MDPWALSYAVSAAGAAALATQQPVVVNVPENTPYMYAGAANYPNAVKASAVCIRSALGLSSHPSCYAAVHVVKASVPIFPWI